MGKSLTDIAKRILSESNDSAPDRDAKSSNPNMATLKPKSKVSEPDPKHNEADDLGPATVSPTDPATGPAKAADKMSKDSSKSSKSSVPAEGRKQQAQVNEDADAGDEVIEEDFEISEELQTFIEEKLAEGLSEEEIAQAIEENFEIVTEEEEINEEDLDYMTRYEVKDGKATKSKAPFHEKDGPNHVWANSAEEAVAKHTKKTMKEETEEEMEEMIQVDMSEDVAALLSGEELSEDFKEKAKTIMEAAVNAKVQAEIARLEEAYAESLEEEVAAIKQSLEENVDNYLNYVVEQWVAENEVAITSGLRAELSEDFISGLRQLFAEHYIDIPEDKVVVVEELGTKIAELEQKLNEEIEHNVNLTKMINESTQNQILADACDGLTDTQAEKLKALAEGLDFTNASEYSQKIGVLKESYFTKAPTNDKVLDNGGKDAGDKSMISEQVDSRMSAYIRSLPKPPKSKS